MIFGAHVAPAGDVGAAEWIGASCRGDLGTVGSLVPGHYESVVRVGAPAPCPDDWWALYREVFRVIAAVGERHTSTPDQAWFAIWDGHGFDKGWTRIAHRGPLDDESSRALDQERAALEDEDRRRNAAIRAALAPLVRFERPHRSYYLAEGPVTAAIRLSLPGFEGWRNPDLFWPDDRRWFVATDVDFWSVYVAGERTLVDEIADGAPTPVEPVSLDSHLPIED